MQIRNKNKCRRAGSPARPHVEFIKFHERPQKATAAAAAAGVKATAAPEVVRCTKCDLSTCTSGRHPLPQHRRSHTEGEAQRGRQQEAAGSTSTSTRNPTARSPVTLPAPLYELFSCIFATALYVGHMLRLCIMSRLHFTANQSTHRTSLRARLLQDEVCFY